MTLRSAYLIILIASIISSCGSKQENSEHKHESLSESPAQADTVKKSIPKEEHVQIGKAHIMIKYHAPAVRGRTIWGGLVPYDEVWVTGAHRATSFEVDTSLKIGDQEIAAGKYAIFTIPGKDTWTVILNRNWDQHLADEYDQKEDVIRLQVKPEPLETVQERLKYSIVPTNDTAGSVDIRWEKVKISIPFKIM